LQLQTTVLTYRRQLAVTTEKAISIEPYLAATIET